MAPLFLTPRRILLVDDDPLICDLIDDALHGGGYEVTIVCDGRDVMEALWSLDPALVILDCNLPGRTGMAVLEDIRTSAPNCAEPVMVLTGRKGNWNEAAAMRNGADRYMRKPFEIVDLQVSVGQLVHGAKPCGP